MYDFHKDKARYFQFQYLTARDHILPFVQDFFLRGQSLQVLEIGCAEAGVLKAFIEAGHICTGIELYESRIEFAKQFNAEALADGKIRFINKNIYDIDIDADLGTHFDLIILKDVIEHIPNQDRVVPKIAEFLKPNGLVFLGFPPWQMPFGGHQQICSAKFLRVLPWFHLLPVSVYEAILKLAGESDDIIKELLEIKSTGISIERFERIVSRSDLRIALKKFYLFNPIYEYKFGLKSRTQFGFISSIPVLRNFFTSAVYYLVSK